MKRIWGVLAVLLALTGEAQAQVGTFKRLIDLVDARTIASNGGGTPATLTLTPIGSYVTLTCNDPDTCTITMGETGVADGQHLAIVNVSTNACTFTTSAGVLQLSSSASLAQWGVLYLEYVTDRWVEVARNGGGGGTVTTTGSPANGNLTKFSGASTITNADLTGDVTTTGTVATTIANDAVSNAKLRNSGALSVIGRSANSTGDPADISATAASDQVLRESGSVLGFGTIATAGIANDAVTYAKIQNVTSATRLLGRGSSAGSGDPEEITLGTGLSMSGTTLTATGSIASNAGSPTQPQGRLTLTSSTPWLTSTVTAATTIYYTPTIGQYVPIYDGSSWTMTLFSELSQTTTDTTKSPAAVTTNSNYDLFIWNDGGTMRCTRGPLWSSDTSRGTGAGTTELTRIGGVLVNNVAITNGPNAQRGTYVGTVRSNGSSQIDFIVGGSGGAGGEGTILGLWNMYNRAPILLTNFDNTDSWNYTTATYRLKNAAASTELNKIKFVIGLQGDGISASNYANASNSTGGVTAQINVGLNSTSTPSGTIGQARSPAANNGFTMVANYSAMAPLGFNYVAPLEWSTASGTQTWFGDGGAAEKLSWFVMQTTY